MKKIVYITLWMTGSLGILSLLWSALYLILLEVSKLLKFSWPPILLHVTSALIGLLLFSVFISQLISRLKPARMNYFQALIQAIRQIAKGNYNIDLDLPVPLSDHPNNPFRVLDENIRYMANELREIERIRQEFISNVSHEIQSPLTSIKGFARALENPKLTAEERQHYLQIIQGETTRLSSLSDHLLKLTALENEKHPMHFEKYRVDRQLRQVLLLLETKWKEKNLQLEIQLTPITLEADADLLNQVWYNLIDNSIKFTEREGSLSIELMKKKNDLVFSIKDSGIGIRDEDRPHLFERFYKADRSRNRKQSGNGLGLSIVKKIIDVHGGNIAVASTYGKGTQFIVRLPLERPMALDRTGQSSDQTGNQ
ncbi:MAG: HAMP domain-containing sensor histidine kinase [Sporolactobacillus sp.]